MWVLVIEGNMGTWKVVGPFNTEADAQVGLGKLVEQWRKGKEDVRQALVLPIESLESQRW